MFTEKTLRLGYIPVKRNVFDKQAPIDTKYAIEQKIRELAPPAVEIIGCDDIAPDGLIYELDDIDRVAAKMKAADVDGLFFAHCNFGTEEVIVRIAKQLDVPVLLWGPRDVRPVPGEIRLQDTQCGLFASSKGLLRIGRPYSYIVNCALQEERFSKGFLQFLGTLGVVRAFRKRMRILQIGSRPRQFLSVMCNESDLLGRFGIDVVPQPFYEVVNRMDGMVGANDDAFAEKVRALAARVDVTRLGAENLKRMVALIEVIGALAAENDCYAVASECWTLFPQTIGIRPCFVNGELTARGLPVSCETDILGAVSSLLLQGASLDEGTTFFADVTIRHPDNDNAELLWHCGPFPHALKAQGEKGFVNELGKGQWRIQDGPITVCRFDGAGSDYRLLVGEGRTTEGPQTESTYLWFETDDWDRWEEKLIFGPYIHHLSGLHGNYGRILAEASKYMPGVTLDAMDAYPPSLGR